MKKRVSLDTYLRNRGVEPDDFDCEEYSSVLQAAKESKQALLNLLHAMNWIPSNNEKCSGEQEE